MKIILKIFMQNLKAQMAAAEKALQKAQADLNTEKTAHGKTKAELENLRKQVKDLKAKVCKTRHHELKQKQHLIVHRELRQQLQEQRRGLRVEQ
jgi:predicted  nucleic acid-binding Zn-ribbon protein